MTFLKKAVSFVIYVLGLPFTYVRLFPMFWGTLTLANNYVRVFFCVLRVFTLANN